MSAVPPTPTHGTSIAAARAVGCLALVAGIVQDCRYALRTFGKSPLFVFGVISTLSVAIGLSTGIFTLINSLLLKPLPVRDPHELVYLHTTTSTNRDGTFSLETVRLWTARQHACSSMMAWFQNQLVNVETPTGRSRVGVTPVSDRYFDVLGVRPSLGRVIDDRDGSLSAGSANMVAVASHGFWARQLGGDPEAIGRSIVIEGIRFTVVGVMPDGFKGTNVVEEPDLFVPLLALPAIRRQAGAAASASISGIRLVGRLRPGISVFAARAEAQILWPPIREMTLLPTASAGQRDRLLLTSIEVSSAERGVDSAIRDKYASPLFIIFIVALLLSAIACINVGGLMSSRLSWRRNEVVVRLTLGASVGRVMRQVVIEGMLLALAAGAIGIGIGYLVSSLIVAVILRDYLATAGVSVVPDYRVFLFAVSVAVVIGILCSVVPGWCIVRGTIRGGLREQARGGTGRSRPQRWIVITQVALSVALVIDAGLLVRTLRSIYSVATGIQVDHVFVAFPRPTSGGYQGGARANDNYYAQLTDRLQAIPGVERVAISLAKPGGATPAVTSVASTDDTDGGTQGIPATPSPVSPGFFDLFGIRLVTGRDFTWHDNSTSARVAVLSQSLAKRLFPNREAVGQRIRMGAGANDQSVEVVGVVADARVYDVKNPDEKLVYSPALQSPDADWKCLIVRASSFSSARLREAVESLGREYVSTPQSLSFVIGRTLLQARLITT